MSVLDEFADAIDRNDLPRIESLLANGLVDANARLRRKAFYRRLPALSLAAGLEHNDVVGLLLRFGARIDDADACGFTACHVVACDHADALAFLLTHKPNLALKCYRGLTPLEYSFLNVDKRCSMMLIEAGAPLEGVDRRNLCRLADSVSAIQTLLRRGVVVSELRDTEGQSPLHIADFSNSALLDMLVNECGVDLEARDNSGSTCLHVACMHGNTDGIRFLIAAGANLEAVDDSGCTPLHIFSDEQCTILLLAAGADVHARDRFGKTPLMAVASHFGNAGGMPFVHPRVNVLLAGGADLDVADHDGKTARQVLLVESKMTFDDAQPSEEVETARREIAKVRLDFVRHRAWQVCVGLQSRGLDALQMCEILLHACGPVAPVVAFHQWWKIATTVKHFKRL
jgi:ankyrin repeat protein